MKVDRLELKALVVKSCGKAVLPETISEDELLFGPDAPLALDSLDALQLSMAVQKRYGPRLTDSKETRRVMATIASLAEFLESRLASEA